MPTTCEDTNCAMVSYQKGCRRTPGLIRSKSFSETRKFARTPGTVAHLQKGRRCTTLDMPTLQGCHSTKLTNTDEPVE
jgi:hypothetical protein